MSGVYHYLSVGKPERSPLSAIFDLDDTLLDGDSTSAWIKGRVRRSLPRLFLAVIALPIAVPLTLFAGTRRIGGSMFLWIASFGLSEPELRWSFEQFASELHLQGSVSWRPAGIACLEAHIANGEAVLIATAAPEWLAQSLSKTLACQPSVIGSRLVRFLGGWIADYHCRHLAKCNAIQDAGYGEHWCTAYSDSEDDGPLLARASQAFLVNGCDRTRNQLLKQKVVVTNLCW